jgi:peptide/nickel transport system substrate-binding protein
MHVPASGLSLTLLTFLATVGAALPQGIPKDAWPASWFEPPQTASQVGLTRFRQSPMLDADVAEGRLPPLRERLPEDPIVVQPLKTIGRYGGTAVVFTTSSNWWGEGAILNNIEPPLRIDPEVREVLPNYARDWEYSADGTTLTLYLRKGIRWSDGHPVTADDYLFWFEKVSCNKELSPIQGKPWDTAQVTKVDDYTVRYQFKDPNPFFINQLAQHGDGYVYPKHFFKKFHPDFVPREELEKAAHDMGLRDWVAYFGRMRSLTDPDVKCPSLHPFVIERCGPSYLVLRRNPYYPKVDPEGNQLPYIDKILALVVQDQEMMTAKACTGQATIAGYNTETSDIPLFKHGEDKCGYKTYIWNRLHGADVAIECNMTVKDPVLRRIFRDVRFRRALSLAINRGEINQTLYFGHATPRATTVIPTSEYFEERFANAYIDYDPGEARRLLDEMGVVDRDGDGKRDRPDGSPLAITLEWTPMETPKGPTMELVVEYWRQVGLDIGLKQISGNLLEERVRGNMIQMGLWHADQTTDILFPPEPYWFVPMRWGWEVAQWPLWSLWYLSDGEEGEKPTPEAMQLLTWWKEMSTTMDEERRIELGKKILASHAENLWTIGTVGMAPHPLVVGNRLHNVPEHGYWGWDDRWSFPYHPETWYLSKN